MRNLDLRSSLSLKVYVLHWFYVFWKIDFNYEQKLLKVLDLEMISSDIWWKEEVYEMVLFWFSLLTFNFFKDNLRH